MELTQNDWLAAVASASTKNELLEFLRTYVSAHALDQGLIAAQYRPRNVRDVRELADIAFTLNQASLAKVGDAHANEALDRFAQFFGAASQRAAALLSVAPHRQHARMDLERED